jgi:hypothetical protein
VTPFFATFADFLRVLVAIAFTPNGRGQASQFEDKVLIAFLDVRAAKPMRLVERHG